VIDPDQPARSAITVAGISGCSARIARTRASNGVNDIGTAFRSYFGGRSDFSARSTVDRPIPSCRATCRRGTPSATSRLINAQSSTEITHPICLGGLVFDRRYGLVFKPATHSWGQRRADPPNQIVYPLDREYTLRALKWTQRNGTLLSELTGRPGVIPIDPDLCNQ
jgi:hypothetical protein